MVIYACGYCSQTQNCENTISYEVTYIFPRSLMLMVHLLKETGTIQVKWQAKHKAYSETFTEVI